MSIFDLNMTCLDNANESYCLWGKNTELRAAWHSPIFYIGLPKQTKKKMIEFIRQLVVNIGKCLPKKGKGPRK